jgi:hypothetical protein
VEIDVRSPRTLQATGAAVVLLGFAADFRAFVPVALVVLLAAYVLVPAARPYRTSWATEVALLVVASALFIAGRAGWAWTLALLAAGVAALAAAADVWIAQEPDPER